MEPGGETCSVFISRRGAIIVKSAVDAAGGSQWLKPIMTFKGRPSAEEIGAAILLAFKYHAREKLTPEDIIEESVFASWEELASECSLLTASMNNGSVTVSPYFSGAGGEYYLVLNRDRTVDANAFEVGNAVLKSLEYCE